MDFAVAEHRRRREHKDHSAHELCLGEGSSEYPWVRKQFIYDTVKPAEEPCTQFKKAGLRRKGLVTARLEARPAVSQVGGADTHACTREDSQRQHHV